MIPVTRVLSQTARVSKTISRPQIIAKMKVQPTIAARRFATAAPTSAAKTDMFCFQCEQTQDVKGCTTIGVCGKTPETAALQDLLLHQLKGISIWAKKARELGAKSNEIDVFMLQALFSTLTNVNFDSARFIDYNKKADQYRIQAKKMYEDAAKAKGKTVERIDDSAYVLKGNTVQEMEARGQTVGVLSRKKSLGDDNVHGLQELITYGLKGLAAYADHASVYGKENDEIFGFVHETLNHLAANDLAIEGLLGWALKVGEMNYKVMEMLEGAELSAWGNPTPTPVRTSGIKGKAILISGHDLKDVHELLKQTEGTGINVYTHGELLPAHGYPELKKYKHLAGNYGGAWQLQKFDFANFPGPIVMTTNCIIEPRKSYKDRIYTRSVVGWPGVKHINNYDFSDVIKTAQSMKGFEKDEPEKTVLTGLGKNTILSLAGKVIDAVKAKQINHFFFIGGCDGSEGERSYFKDLAVATPKDSVIITAGCGKYRFNSLPLGDIGGIPRILDMGQCNDSYGAIQVAAALAKAFNVGINDLPLSFAVSWFEQKAVAVLLTLLHLGVQNIHLGPNLPAFCTPTMLAILQEKFKLRTTNPDVKADLKMMLAGHK